MSRPRFVESLAFIVATLAVTAPRVVPQTADALPRVIQRPEPVLASAADQSPGDAIVTIAATIDTSGALAGPIEIVSLGADQRPRFSVNAADPATVLSLIEQAASRETTSRVEFDRVRAAFDALLQWRFQPAATPVRTAFGFNFARVPESGMETEPVPVGRDVAPPAKVRDVRPVYPADAIGRQLRGAVVVELVVDGAGIPVSAFAARPVEGVSMAAVQSALQARFTRDPTYSRRLLTIASDFALAGAASVLGGIPGAPPPPPPGPRAPVRVGGNIAPPTRINDVPPVMPEVARQARVQGVVILEIVIGTDGKIQDAKILRSIPLLDQAALDCVRQWEYTPTLLNGTPVPVIMTVTVNFTQM